MGGARALVAGSTSWPACTCRVSNSGSLQDERERRQMCRRSETPLLVEVGRHRGPRRREGRDTAGIEGAINGVHSQAPFTLQTPKDYGKTSSFPLRVGLPLRTKLARSVTKVSPVLQPECFFFESIFVHLRVQNPM